MQYDITSISAYPTKYTQIFFCWDILKYMRYPITMCVKLYIYVFIHQNVIVSNIFFMI
jgi:hypothetical protein